MQERQQYIHGYVQYKMYMEYAKMVASYDLTSLCQQWHPWRKTKDPLLRIIRQVDCWIGYERMWMLMGHDRPLIWWMFQVMNVYDCDIPISFQWHAALCLCWIALQSLGRSGKWLNTFMTSWLIVKYNNNRLVSWLLAIKPIWSLHCPRKRSSNVWNLKCKCSSNTSNFRLTCL